MTAAGSSWMQAVASPITNLGVMGAGPVRLTAAMSGNALEEVLPEARPLRLLLGAARASREIREDGRIGERPVKPIPPHVRDIGSVLLGTAVAVRHRL